MKESKQIRFPVKAIFFDAAETLFKTRGSVGDIYLKIAKKYGSSANKEAIDLAFFNAFKNEPSPSYPQDILPAERTILEKRWWFKIVKRVFLEVGMISSFENYFEEVYTIFKGNQGWELFPETTEVLSRLKEKGYLTGMITNFDTRVHEVTMALGISHLLDTMTLSSEIGVPKPHPLIFKKAIEAHQINPEEAVHVGDSPSDDIEGALKAGLQAILIDRHHLFEGDQRFIKIESLNELLYYL